MTASHLTGAGYIVAGSLSGTTPGISLPPFIVPLHPDSYFNLSISNPPAAFLSGSQGGLNAQGQGFITISVPPMVLIPGMTINYAATVFGPTLQGVSNSAVTLTAQ